MISGEPAPIPSESTPASRAVSPVAVTIGGVAAEVLFAGAAPGFTGLQQLSFVTPLGLEPGTKELTIEAGRGLSPRYMVPVGQ